MKTFYAAAAAGLILFVSSGCELFTDPASSGGKISVSLLIDFDPDSPGIDLEYRDIEMQGNFNGYDILRHVVQREPELYAKFNFHQSYGASVTGICYDRDKDDDEPEWDPADPDAVIHVDPDDLCRYGWMTNGFWAYYVRQEGEFLFSNIGMSARQLTDGSEDLWVFSSFDVFQEGGRNAEF